MLDQLVRDVEQGRIRNQRSPPAVGVLSDHHTNDEGLRHVTAALTCVFHSSDPRMKEVP
ncbi:hypothetical protein [Streptomyces sp. SAI-144]|uniref:hypothetical protein n=1 Tax=Streptomyces sp. SAI-144 TaxID=2940544 RepID=UPI002473DFA5|nr:hypothetical protein [Streptomyces sp. SAI-144]